MNHSSQQSRRATWLDLFYDLVFVVTISQLADYLEQHLSLFGFLEFLILFIPVWWAWMGTTSFASRFPNNNKSPHRILLLIQMAGVAALAVNIPKALGETYSGFALSYAFIRSITIFEYYLALRQNASDITTRDRKPNDSSFIKRHITGFSFAATIWVVSAFIPVLDIRLLFWAVALMIDFVTPIAAGKLHSQHHPDESYLPDRIGSFTLIVLGESIVAIVMGMSGQVWSIYSVTVASLGLGISFSIGWLYFENIKGSTIIQEVRKKKSRIGIYYEWLYGQFPLVISITAVGVGIRHLVSTEPGKTLSYSDLWLLCGAASMVLISKVIIHVAQTKSSKEGFVSENIWIGYRIGSSIGLIFIPIIGSMYTTSIITAVALVVIFAMQIVLDLKYFPR